MDHYRKMAEALRQAQPEKRHEQRLLHAQYKATLAAAESVDAKLAAVTGYKEGLRYLFGRQQYDAAKQQLRELGRQRQAHAARVQAAALQQQARVHQQALLALAHRQRERQQGEPPPPTASAEGPQPPGPSAEGLPPPTAALPPSTAPPQQQHLEDSPFVSSGERPHVRQQYSDDSPMVSSSEGPCQVAPPGQPWEQPSDAQQQQQHERQQLGQEPPAPQLERQQQQQQPKPQRQGWGTPASPPDARTQPETLAAWVAQTLHLGPGSPGVAAGAPPGLAMLQHLRQLPDFDPLSVEDEEGCEEGTDELSEMAALLQRQEREHAAQLAHLRLQLEEQRQRAEQLEAQLEEEQRRAAALASGLRQQLAAKEAKLEAMRQELQEAWAPTDEGSAIEPTFAVQLQP